MTTPPGTDDRSRLVYVGGIGNGDCLDEIKNMLINEGFAEGDMVEKKVGNDGRPYALIKCKDGKSAFNAIKMLNEKSLKVGVDGSGKDDAGKKMVACSFHAKRVPMKVSYTIDDQTTGYSNFIVDLRKKICDGRNENKSIDYVPVGGAKIQKPLLSGTLEQWIEIELGLKGDATSTTTLVLRNDNLFVHGFKNKQGQWFELRGVNGMKKLPPSYDTKDLVSNSGSVSNVEYSSIMGLNGSGQVRRTLETARLGRAFAERAVRRLSMYPDTDHHNGDYMPVRLGLAGLIVMICEAARMDPFLKHFAGVEGAAGAWEKGMGLKEERLFVCMWHWGHMSAALKKRGEHPFRPWDSRCGVESAEKANQCVHLVLNGGGVKANNPGGARVEILDVSVNFDVTGINLINEQHDVHDSIYTENNGRKKQEDKEIWSLKLSAIAECISGHKWFGMEVERPNQLWKSSLGEFSQHTATRGESSSSKNATTDKNVVKFKWSFREQSGGCATSELVTSRIDNLDSSEKLEVKYLVMSNAAKATLWVRNMCGLNDNTQDLGHEDDLRRTTPAGKSSKGKEYSTQGEIRAFIDGVEEYPIVLFERSSAEGPLKTDELKFPLKRYNVYVPKDKELKIDMSSLSITGTCSSSSDPVVVKKSGPEFPLVLDVPYGEWRSHSIDAAKDSGYVFQVDVSWDKPYTPEPKAVFTIGKDDEFTDFIGKVREEFADQKQLSFVGPPNGTCRLTRPRPASGQPERWIHVKLRVKEQEVGEKEWPSTTLAVQDGRCYGVGFMNQSKIWYDLGYGKQHRDDDDDKTLLQKEYNPVLLGWGVAYKDILGASTWDHVFGELNTAGLGTRSFAEKAVRTLWRYPDVDEGKEDLNARVALAGLIIMVCESARFDPILRYFQDNWDNIHTESRRFDKDIGEFSMEQMKYIWSWGKISRALLLCDDKKGQWPDDDQTPILNRRGITKDAALANVRLVYSDARELQFYNTDSGGSKTTDDRLGLPGE